MRIPGGWLHRALALGVLALALGVQAREGQWTLYTAADGLDRNLITQVVQDKDGYIWSSSRILNRFDGREFKHFPGGGSLYLDRLSNLWVGPLDRNVLLRYDGGQFQEFGPAQGLPDAHIQVTFEDRAGNLWLGTSAQNGGGGGVLRYDKKSFVQFDTKSGLGGNDISSIAQDADGNLWFGLAAYRPGAGKGISRYDGKTFTTFTTANGLPSNEVRDILTAEDKTLWVGTVTGLCRWAGDHFESFSTEDGKIPKDLSIRELFQDREGQIWIGTGTRFEGGRYRSRGVLRYDGKRVTAFDQDALGQRPITSIFEDEAGNLWMAAFGAGLVKFDPSFWRVAEDEPSLSAGILDITTNAEGKAILITKGGALLQVENGALLTLGPESGLPAEKVSGTALDAERHLWVMSGKVLSRRENGAFHKITAEPNEPLVRVKPLDIGHYCYSTEKQVVCLQDGKELRLRRGAELPDGLIQDFFEDRHGVLWVSTWEGLVRQDPNGARETIRLSGRKEDDQILKNLIAGPDGEMWMLSEYSSVYKVEDGKIVDIGQRLGIGKKRFETMFLDRENRLWLGSWGDGLYVYDPAKGGLRHFEETDGVFLADIYTLAEDASGKLWIGTAGGGLVRYDGRSFQSLQSRDGLASDNVRKIVFDGAGDAWLLHLEESATRYRPRKSVPRVELTQAATDQTFLRPESLQLTSGKLKELKFSFQGLSFNVRPEAIRYSWHLEGYDHEWHAPTLQPTALYQDLEPGTYRFEVIAIDRDLNTSTTSASVPLTILLPWYLDRRYSIPVALVAFGALVGMAWLAHQAVSARRAARALREQLSEQEKREKEALAKKNAELEASYTQLESAHGQLAEKSNQLSASNEQLQNTLGELQQTQSQLVHSEKMAALGTMVAGVAHEINNPVNFIHANMPTLQEYVDGMQRLIEAHDEGKDKEEIEEIKEDIDYEFLLEDIGELINGCKTGTERIRQIVLDLRNFSRKDESEMKPVDLHEGIDSGLTILGNTIKGRVQVHKDYAKLPKVMCNAGQINQVVLNLIKNSADAIPNNGDIWIKTWQEGESAILSIRDSGPGIPKDIMSKIFDPFFTTKPVGKGTGLGLSVSMQLVEKHNGKLWAESEPGKGATFFIRLPIQQPKAKK